MCDVRSVQLARDCVAFACSPTMRATCMQQKQAMHMRLRDACRALHCCSRLEVTCMQYAVTTFVMLSILMQGHLLYLLPIAQQVMKSLLKKHLETSI